MKLIYFISQLKLTAGSVDADGRMLTPVLNDTLRPHQADPEDQEGDFVHADLEEAKSLALSIVFRPP